MKIKFQKKKELKSLNISVQNGSFALDKEPIRFESCRERFAHVFTKNLNGFYFKHHPSVSKNIAEFVVKTEMILKQKRFSKFAETNAPVVLWVEPSNFWKKCGMRRSFFTILVRAGMAYDPKKDNYEESLFNEKYAKRTKAAVMRFLFGFTEYKGEAIDCSSSLIVRGWKSTFETQKNEDIKKLLVCSKKKDKFVPATDLKDSLWN